MAVQDKSFLFEKMNPARSLAVMALPTVASQMIVLLYNLADTWFIGRTDNPYMIGGSTLALTIYFAATALSNVFGVGGGSLMARLIGEGKQEDARKVASYSIALSAISSLVLSVLILIFTQPLLRLLGAGDNTIVYAKQYVYATTVFGSFPTVLAMCMPQLLRNTGYSREAGFGVMLGNFLNILLDPLFMFVIFPRGYEVLAAGVATLISNIISLVFFIAVFIKLKGKTVLEIPRRIEKIGSENKRSLYSVGLPAAFTIFLFDIVTIVINRIASGYGDIQLASMGIVLKIERIPLNIGLGVCLGMVPLIAYNYGARNYERMKKFFRLSCFTVIIFAVLCFAVFVVFARPLVGAFIGNETTVAQGIPFLIARSASLPFMLVGYLVVNYMNAVNRGGASFVLAVIRHIILIIPVMLIMNHLWGIDGFSWSQAAADALHTIVAVAAYRKISSKIYPRE